MHLNKAISKNCSYPEISKAIHRNTRKLRLSIFTLSPNYNLSRSPSPFFVFLKLKPAGGVFTLTSHRCWRFFHLPSNLQIEISYDHPWEAYFSGDIEIDENTSPERLSVWLSEIVMSKSSRFPELRSIVIWRCDDNTRSLRISADDHSREVLEVCKAVDVKISLVESEDPPLFSSWS